MGFGTGTPACGCWNKLSNSVGIGLGGGGGTDGDGSNRLSKVSNWPGTTGGTVSAATIRSSIPHPGSSTVYNGKVLSGPGLTILRAPVSAWLSAFSFWLDCAGLSPELRSWRLQFGNLSIDSASRPWRRRTPPATVLQLVVPPGERRMFIQRYHDSVFAGHLGISRTLCRLLDRVYWPDLREDVKSYLGSCSVCLPRMSPCPRRAPETHYRGPVPTKWPQSRPRIHNQCTRKQALQLGLHVGNPMFWVAGWVSVPALPPVGAGTNFPTPWVSVWEVASAPTEMEATVLAKSLTGPVLPVEQSQPPLSGRPSHTPVRPRCILAKSSLVPV